MKRIEVFGTGCMKCRRLEKNVRSAIRKAGVKARICKVEDIGEIMERGILVTPALAVDGDVVVSGRVPGVEELVGMIS